MKASPAKSLWNLTARHRGRYVAAIAAMGVGTIFLLLVPYVLKWALDALSNGTATVQGTLLPAAVAIVACNALNGFFTYLRGKWAAQASEGIVRELRHRLFVHLEHLPCAYHDEADTGDLVQRCSSDVETVRVFLAAQIVELGRVTLFLLVAVPLMLRQDLRMTLVSLSVIPFIITFAILFFRKVRELFEKVDKAEGKLTTVLQENLTGVRVVRAFHQQDFEIEKFQQHNGSFRDLEQRLFLALSNYWALSDILCFGQLGVILIGGGYFAMQGQLSIGTWVMFFWLLRTIIWPIRHFGRVLADSGKASVAIGRIQEILDQPTEENLAPAPELDVNVNVAGDIVIQDLSFAYKNNVPAIAELSMNIREGETVAILGPPGSGKSTLIKLLVRMYEFDHGSITIGGRSVQEMPRETLRHAFGVVLQDPFLFSKTVKQNIAVGKHCATDEEIETWARSSAVHENIQDFEDRYDTKIGERGVTLSGGQRQRLAIARALIKQPQFLVLDDSLSAVDTQTESHILETLAKRERNQTTILIAHRLSSTRLADRIFVFDKGRLTQSGTHKELIDQPGYYRRLWKIQGSFEEELSQDLSASRVPAPHSAASSIITSVERDGEPK